MALFGGVVVADPWLSTQFTQLELRKLKSQFDSLKGHTGMVTASDLETGMQKLTVFQQPLTYDEINDSVRQGNLDMENGLDFEAFLRMYLHLQKCGNPKLGTPKNDSDFLKNASTTLLHTVSNSEKKAFVDHINAYLKEDLNLKKFLPIDPSTNQLMNIVKKGVLLCKLINIAVPGTIDERAINVKDKLNPWERNENHTLCLNSAKAIGCSVVNIGTEDLAEGRPHLVMGLISQIIKMQLLADLNLRKTPQLAEIVEDKQEVEELLHLPPEKVLLRWMNFHLKKGGYKKVVSNFTSDIKDGEAYTILLHTLAPESCDLSPLEVKDPLEKAKLLLAQAEKINCQKYLSPKDIVEGSANLNLAFVAQIFNQRNGLTLDTSRFYFTDGDQDSREEQAFRMWINSLGVDNYVNHLFETVRDGWVLLEVLDKVAPGIVNWKWANKPPIKMPFKKVENCNQVISIGKKLKFSLVNVAGNDIVQGNKKLILAYLWQLMRYNMLHLIKNVKIQGKDVSDADILQWANDTVKNAKKNSSMDSFKDRSLSNGIFFLDLLGAVEPRVVNWSLITKGETDEEKKQNANYIISVARKLGCSIFLLWDDIVEVRPKMILTLTTSIMLWSLSHPPEGSNEMLAVKENGSVSMLER
eukprot:c28927_g1_i4 orf=363-2282(+)